MQSTEEEAKVNSSTLSAAPPKDPFGGSSKSTQSTAQGATQNHSSDSKNIAETIVLCAAEKGTSIPETVAEIVSVPESVALPIEGSEKAPTESAMIHKDVPNKKDISYGGDESQGEKTTKENPASATKLFANITGVGNGVVGKSSGAPTETVPKSIFRSSTFVKKETSTREIMQKWATPRVQPQITVPKKAAPPAPPPPPKPVARPSKPKAALRSPPLMQPKMAKESPPPAPAATNLVAPPRRKRQVAAKSAIKGAPLPKKRASQPSTSVGSKKKAKTKKQTSGSKAPSPKKQTSPGTKRGAAPMVWEGRPDESLEGGWPDGWIKRLYSRMSGETTGRKDRYWFPPESTGPANLKLRSMLEVKRYLKAFRETGDVDTAFKARKG